MYVEIIDNKLLSWCEAPYMEYEFVDIDYNTFDISKYKIKNNKLINIENTNEYKKRIKKQENSIKLEDLKIQIQATEKNIQRSLIAKISGNATKEDLEYFDNCNAKIIELREQIVELNKQ